MPFAPDGDLGPRRHRPPPQSRLPLRARLLAALPVAATLGLSSLELGGALGVPDQEATWLALRRLRSAMGGALGGPPRGEAEADVTILGAPGHRRRGRPGEGSRKVTVLVIAAAGSARVRMRVVPDARAVSLLPVIGALVEPGATATADGLTSCPGLPALGLAHRRLPRPPGGMRASPFHSTPHADAAMSNRKQRALGTCRKPPADPQPYLDEFCSRAESSGRRDAALGAVLTAMMRPTTTFVIIPT